MKYDVGRISLKFPAKPCQGQILGIRITGKCFDLVTLLREERAQASCQSSPAPGNKDFQFKAPLLP